MEKLVELMQLQLQQQREEMQAQEQRFREQAERQHADMKAMLQLLAKPPQSSYRQRPATPTFCPLIPLRSCGRIVGRGFSPLRELMLSQMTEFSHQPVIDGV